MAVIYADNGFGELVNIQSPYGGTTTVFAKEDGILQRYIVDHHDHVAAIKIVREHLGHQRSLRGHWNGARPVLALVEGAMQ